LPEIDYGADVSLEIRLSVFNAVTAEFFLPDIDAMMRAEFLENVWSQEKRVVGIRVKNHLDLHDLEGWVDIRRAELSAEGDQLRFALDAEAGATGRAKGRAYGVKVDTPLEAASRLVDDIPLEIAVEQDHLILRFPPNELEIPTRLTLPIFHRPVSREFDIKLQAEQILKPIVLTRWMQRDVAIPASMRRKKVTSTKLLPVRVDWRADVLRAGQPSAAMRLSGRIEILEGIIAEHENAAEPGNKPNEAPPADAPQDPDTANEPDPATAL
jgi:hypothetical protein